MTQTTASVDTPRVTDETLLEKARTARNGAAFARRFDNGYDSAELRDRYDSRFAAAKALLFNLCWWTAGDRTQARRLFERSALGSEFAERGWLDSKLPELLDEAVAELDGKGYLVNNEERSDR